MPRFLIAAAHKSSGKTVLSVGLAAAFAKTGLKVQTFKKGPDYIDPMWLRAASGAPCYNLDFNTMSAAERLALLASHSSDADITLVEANKGLFDGVASDGSDSNAQLAKELDLPVILVIDTSGMTRGIAPLLVGYQSFDPAVNIAGVILNKVGGSRHEAKLRAAVSEHTDIPVIGAVWRNADLDIGERHLGLTTPAETGELQAKIARVGDIVAESVELDTLMKIASTAPTITASPAQETSPKFNGIRIGVAQDESFGFYYPDDLEAFETLGATLVPFDAIRAAMLPEIDGLFIGGGFPEVAMQRLSANKSLRQDVKARIDNGLPTYAECGGLMYLCDTLTWKGSTVDMCGVVPGNAVMCDRPQGRGYTKFQSTNSHPWGAGEGTMAAHEFHYARIDNLGPDTTFARRITRGHGIDGAHDGVVINNLLAGFCHLRNTDRNPWVSKFLEFVTARSS